MEEATYLTKYAREVLLIHRRDEFRASKIMVERALSNPKIRVVLNTVVTEVLGEDAIRGLLVRDTVTGEEREIEVGGLFVAIGHTPNTSFLGGQLETTPHGYIVTRCPWRTETSVEGVFAAGDAIDDYYRQAITSAGTGCMAALEAERWLAHQGVGESPVLETAESSVGKAGEL
jgi:thioredoxin reductase (NADPH)